MTLVNCNDDDDGDGVKNNDHMNEVNLGEEGKDGEDILEIDNNNDKGIYISIPVLNDIAVVYGFFIYYLLV
jgi:hypothetical protein